MRCKTGLIFIHWMFIQVIFLLNNYNKTIDTVSKWRFMVLLYATSNSPALELNGNAIPEGQSPPTKDGSGMISCVDVMNKIFLNEND